MTPEELSEAIIRLAGMDSQMPMDEAIAYNYRDMLKPIPGTLVLMAIRRLMATQRWRPSPSEILNVVLDLVNPAPTASEALKSLKGTRLTELFMLHPAVQRTMELLGGGAAMQATEEHFSERFSRAYERGVEEWRSLAKIDIIEGRWVPELPAKLTGQLRRNLLE